MLRYDVLLPLFGFFLLWKTRRSALGQIGFEPVPEPSTWALLGLGVLALAAAARTSETYSFVCFVTFCKNFVPRLMKHVFTAARILLGLIFLVFSLNYWLQFIPIPGQPEGSHGASFMGAIFATKFLTVVKILELVAAVLLLSGRYVNLALVLLGPIIVNIALFHILVAPGNYGLTVVICVLALVILIGQKSFLRAIFAK